MPMILVQGIGFVGTGLYFLSYQCADNRRLFRMQLLSYAFYTLHLLLLGAYTGAASYIVNLLRSFLLSRKGGFGKSRRACALLCLLQLALLPLTWEGALSLLPVAANIASTVAGYTFDAKKIRYAGLFVNSPLWIVYDILVGSFAGIADEAVSMLSMVISLLRFRRKGE